MKASLRGLSLLVLTVALAACGGGGGGSINTNGNGANAGNNGAPGTGNDGGNHDTPPPNFSIGGTVAGLPDGGQLSILDNGASTQTISANGPFTLSATVPSGTSYSISLDTQPPGYQCAVTQGSGTVAASNITDIAIACTQITATVGGSISGLNATGLVLANGNDTLNVPATMTTFTMPTAVASGATYNVVVRSHPVNVRCTVSNGSGTGGDSAVSNIGVTCGPASLSTLYSFGNAEDGKDPSPGLIQGSDGNLYGTTSHGGAYDSGTVFRITPAGEHTVLWSFGAVDEDGYAPVAAPLQGSDGNLYGTTFGGGAYGGGTIFRITPAGEYTVLWSFGGNDTDGRAPNGLTQASDGNFYGMTEFGGTQNDGTVFRLTPSGTVTLMVSFDPDNGGPAGPENNGLIRGRDGNLYGLTDRGGGSTSGAGTLFRMTLDGAVTKLATFDGDHGSGPVGSPIEASDGNFYGLTQYGDANGWGNLFRVTPAGEITSLHAFNYPGDAYAVGGLIEDADGNLYGMTCDSDGTIFRLDRSGTDTTLYSFPVSGTSATCPQGTLLKSADGTLYGVTSDGGTNGSGTVFQIN
jgi:uncharacterized repeat protein (TIGR03803 family)